jgi:DNA topoisomerase VI subunit B
MWQRRRDSAVQKLDRATFEISRELEFFSEKELQMQIGHGRELWPVALLKELIDNALDACETANEQPRVEVEIGDNAFSVRDNGPGLPKETLVRSLDYLKRVSDKALYVSPTRGQVGNALKTVWAAPFVAHGERGCVEIWSQGLHHTVEVSLDRLSRQPAVRHAVEEEGFVRIGTLIKIHWPDLACSTETVDDDSSQSTDFPTMAQELVEGYAAFNPHATFTLGDTILEATDPDWKKWTPGDPTSPHWYTPDTLRDLVAAYVSQEREGGRKRTVRELVSEFRGLAGTAKQKQVTGDLSGVYLHDLVRDDAVDMASVNTLLQAMMRLSRAPKPVALGLIGKEHLSRWMVAYADVSEQSIRYKKYLGVEAGSPALPYILEAAFGVRNNNESQRRIVSGLNWSPTLTLSADQLGGLLGEMRIDEDDPVVVIVHISKPRFNFVDRGKTRLSL